MTVTDDDIRRVLSDFADLAPHETSFRIGSEATRKRGRRRYLAPLLSAAAMLVVAAGATLFATDRSSDHHEASPGGGPLSACLTPLPAAWAAALHTTQVSVPDSWLTPITVTPAKRVIVDWQGRDGVFHLGSLSTTGQLTEFFHVQIPQNHIPLSVFSDATHVMIPITAAGPSNNPAAAPIDDIVLVDITTHQARHVLAGMPTNYVVAVSKVAILQDDSVYWLVHTADNPHQGALMSYSIASNTYQALPVDTSTVNWSPLGISWQGGALPAQSIPSSAPPVDDHTLTIAIDGGSLAWSSYARPDLIRWTDNARTERTVKQGLAAQIDVSAVSGPYVFLTSGEGDDTDKLNGHLYVLDTRTGAIADTGRYPGAESASAEGFVALSADAQDGPMTLLDTIGLPELQCR